MFHAKHILQRTKEILLNGFEHAHAFVKFIIFLITFTYTYSYPFYNHIHDNKEIL